jgi:crossover junction endodeoxyribonuclease RuvC
MPMKFRVLGVDPGSRATGWALVVAEGNRYHLESTGVIRPRGTDRPRRLADLHHRLCELLLTLVPDTAAVESSFSGLNPKSGLALAESRGVILAALGEAGHEVRSYSPAEVKSAIVGTGRAEKQQIAYMVVRLLGLQDRPPVDAADAIAVALTHIHSGGCKTTR